MVNRLLSDNHSDLPNQTMSVAIPDPDETDVSALDDRNLTTDPDFELNEQLSFGAGYGGRDPADDGEY